MKRSLEFILWQESEKIFLSTIKIRYAIQKSNFSSTMGENGMKWRKTRLEAGGKSGPEQKKALKVEGTKGHWFIYEAKTQFSDGKRKPSRFLLWMKVQCLCYQSGLAIREKKMAFRKDNKFSFTTVKNLRCLLPKGQITGLKSAHEIWQTGAFLVRSSFKEIIRTETNISD